MDTTKWDQRYREPDREPRPAKVLGDNLHLLPATGRALDLACGLGGNALLLAERGLTVEAWDSSQVAIEKLRARAAGCDLEARVVTVTPETLPANRFDVIVVSYFLERDLAPALIAALRPGGLLFYQTFNHIRLDRGPNNPAWRLEDNELLRLFAPLAVRYYREDGRGGEIPDEALLVAQKPPLTK